MVGFDKTLNRLGYGKGYYDRFLNKYLKKSNKPVTVGIAFSFQKHHKLKLYLYLTAMREYRDEIKKHGFDISYTHFFLHQLLE